MWHICRLIQWHDSIIIEFLMTRSEILGPWSIFFGGSIECRFRDQHPIASHNNLLRLQQLTDRKKEMAHSANTSPKNNTTLVCSCSQLDNIQLTLKFSVRHERPCTASLRQHPKDQLLHFLSFCALLISISKTCLRFLRPGTDPPLLNPVIAGLQHVDWILFRARRGNGAGTIYKEWWANLLGDYQRGEIGPVVSSTVLIAIITTVRNGISLMLRLEDRILCEGFAVVVHQGSGVHMQQVK